MSYSKSFSLKIIDGNFRRENTSSSLGQDQGITGNSIPSTLQGLPAKFMWDS